MQIARPAQKALTDAICEHYSVYNLVTFTINFGMRDEFLKWIKPLAKKSFVCEEGTDVYDVYNGHWQVNTNDPGVADLANADNTQFTYTIFEKFKNQAALKYHGNGIKGTAIYTWRDERDKFASTAPTFCKTGPPCKLKLTVTHPTSREFNNLKAIVDKSGSPAHVFDNARYHHVGDTQCKAYAGYKIHIFP